MSCMPEPTRLPGIVTSAIYSYLSGLYRIRNGSHHEQTAPPGLLLRRDQTQVRGGARSAARVPARRHATVHVRFRRRTARNTASDPYSGPVEPREPIRDTVEVLFIGGGFSALLTSARLREKGVESIRIVERGADVGGTWYWNRYPGVACDVVSYDYLPLLDEMDYVPKHHYAARPGDLRVLPGDREALRPVRPRGVPDHGDVDGVGRSRAACGTSTPTAATTCAPRFVICANGTLSKPKLSRIDGMETFKGHSFHTSRWDYDYTGADLEKLQRQGRRHHRHRRDRRAGRARPRREREGAVRLPAHAVVDRRPRRLADRPGVGGEAASPAGRRSAARARCRIRN